MVVSRQPDANARQPSQRSAPALAAQLELVARCARGVVSQGKSLTDLLAQVPPATRPGVQSLVFHVLRRWGRAQALVRRLAPRRPEAATEALLTVAVALMVDQLSGVPEAGSPHYDVHTLVNQTVEAAKRAQTTRRHAPFINACLRRLLRDSASLQDGLEQDLQARWNHPAWWVQRLRRDHPQHWSEILQANNRAGPMTLRVNRRRISRGSYGEALQREGWTASPVGDDGWVLDRPQPVDRLPGFGDGLCSVQDAAAQLAAPMLLDGMTARRPDGARWRVLDACAAPGGKTAHLLECADLDLLALDVDPVRCERISQTLARLGLVAQVRAADAARPDDWWDGRRFDAILLDAPCSASGIVRRHPDVRWLRREDDVLRLAQIQRQLLETLWALLVPGGRLLYVTCSVFRAEGEDQILAFLSRHSDARRQPSVGHLLPSSTSAGPDFADNVPGGYDGFYYARLDKDAG